MTDSAARTCDVAIVGAGVAGLAAMREVEERGLRTCVIEARERIGGRIYTVLVGWVGCPQAERPTELLEDEIRDRAIASLAANFGVQRRRIASQVDGCWMHNWQYDPYSRGSYSYPRVGGLKAGAAHARSLA